MTNSIYNGYEIKIKTGTPAHIQKDTSLTRVFLYVCGQGESNSHPLLGRQIFYH